jgi:hypothetical protein
VRIFSITGGSRIATAVRAALQVKVDTRLSN